MKEHAAVAEQDFTIWVCFNQVCDVLHQALPLANNFHLE